MKKTISAILAATILLNLTSCGTFLYPERTGQKGGNIDPSIAILDGIGLLFFIIPGVIAFAVDFGNGTIYLPKSGNYNDARINPDEMLPYYVGHGVGTKDKMAALIANRTGRDVRKVRAELDNINMSAN